MRIFSTVCAAVLALSAGVAEARNEVSRQITVDSSFFEDAVRWTGFPPSYSYRMRIIAVDGKLEVCGAGAYRSGTLRRETLEVLKGTAVFVGDRAIVQDLTFFNQVSRPSKLMGAAANCVATGIAVPSNNDVRISVRNVGKNNFVVR